MHLRNNVGLAVLVLALTLGCTDRDQAPRRVKIEATLENGDVVIHKDHHTTAIVGPGERVEWACLCDPDLEFAVADLRPMLDLDHLTELYMDAQDQAMREGATVGAEDPTRVLEGLASAFFPAEPGPYQWPTGERPAAGRFEWTSGVQGDAFTDGTILSPPVPQGARLVLWKFTWKVRRKGDPSREAVWDPHILTHAGRDY